MEEKISILVEEYKRITAKECYKFIVSTEEASILDDKIGGVPYLPVGVNYPLDSEGKPMPLLLQVNLRNVNIDGWNKTGILEVFLDRSLSYPCEYVIKYFEEGLEYQTEIPNIDLSEFVIDKSIKIDLVKDICHMPLSDYRANDIICKIANRIYGTNITSLFELDEVSEDVDWYVEITEAINNPLGMIGGYADFSQSDPRGYEVIDKDECLFKIDSFLDKRLYIGDAGIIFGLISKEDIKNNNFSNALVDWDCC